MTCWLSGCRLSCDTTSPPRTASEISCIRWGSRCGIRKGYGERARSSVVVAGMKRGMALPGRHPRLDATIQQAAGTNKASGKNGDARLVTLAMSMRTRCSRC